MKHDVCRLLTIGLAHALAMTVALGTVQAQENAPLSDIATVVDQPAIQAVDHPWDDGSKIDVIVRLPDFAREIAARYRSDDDPRTTLDVVIEGAPEFNGVYSHLARVTPNEQQWDALEVTVTSDKHIAGEPHWFRYRLVQNDGTSQTSTPNVYTAEDQPGIASRQRFDGGRGWLAIITAVICGSVVQFILLARMGRELKIRKIAGLEAIEEAVGRATEMGRACLYVPGIQDMNDIQTIAGLTILSRVAEQAAEYDCVLETPTSKSLVMTAAREAVATAFLKAGRPDAYNEDLIYYVTDEQFAYVSFLTGKMVREQPAACFYLGAFFAESLILAETGNAIGAIQVSGTAQPAQLPFFVAACDYTLIGEEFFAASAYLSGDPDQLGSLKGQDVGKIIVGGLIIVGVTLLTLVEFTQFEALHNIAEYLMDTVLQSA